ncbi:Antirestriction protein KlcA [compost metagenome]
MSADAAGITASLFAICDLAQGGDEKLIDAYYALRDFAAEHAEANEIYSAID